MARERKRRFVVTAGGRDREMLSAFERRNGDLLIGLRHANFYEDGTGIKYQRYSVHRSLNSNPPLCTIKHTLGLEDGRDITTAQVRYRENAPFQALLFTKAGPSFELDRYAVRLRAGDEVVRLHADETDQFIVVLAVAVAAKDGAKDLLEDLNLTVVRSEFAYFDLQIGIGFIPVLPFDQGVVGHSMTSAPRASGIAIQEMPVANLEVLSTDAIRQAAEISMASASNYLQTKLIDGDRFKLGDELSPERLSLLRKLFELRFRHPAFPDQSVNAPR